MIQPTEILRKAENLYPAFLQAWLEGETFFPRDIPSDKRPDKNLALASASVQLLRAESCEVQGQGYSIEWVEKNSPTHGRNKFPQRIFFASAEDYLPYIGKKREFARFVEIAYGSLMEVVSLAEVAFRQTFLIEDNRKVLRESAEELARMLSGLKSSLLAKAENLTSKA